MKGALSGIDSLTDLFRGNVLPPFRWGLLGSVVLHCALLILIGQIFGNVSWHDVRPQTLWLTLSTPPSPIDQQDAKDRVSEPSNEPMPLSSENVQPAAEVQPKPAPLAADPEPLSPAEPDSGETAIPHAKVASVTQLASSVAEPSAEFVEQVTEPELTVVEASFAAPVAEPPPRTEPVSAAEQRTVLGQIEKLLTQGGHSAPVQIEVEGQMISAEMHYEPAEDPQALDTMRVVLSTDREGRRLQTEMAFRRVAYSHYAQFVDRWDDQVSIHDDAVVGRFHSNTGVQVGYSRSTHPRFTGRVTTAGGVRFVSDESSRINRRPSRTKVFTGGLETRSEKIHLPTDAIQHKDISPGLVTHLNDGARLTFFDDGTFRLAQGARDERNRLHRPVHYFLASELVEIHVSGTIDGAALVYTPGTISIVGDLRYAANPLAGESDDYLALLADRNIEIAGDDVIAVGDLTVQAAIFARRRFVVRDYRRRNRGKLEILGSVTSGRIGATEPRYATRIVYDTRFDGLRPPGFPMTSQYELAAWSGEWIETDEGEPVASPSSGFCENQDSAFCTR